METRSAFSTAGRPSAIQSCPQARSSFRVPGKRPTISSPTRDSITMVNPVQGIAAFASTSSMALSISEPGSSLRGTNSGCERCWPRKLLPVKRARHVVPFVSAPNQCTQLDRGRKIPAGRRACPPSQRPSREASTRRLPEGRTRVTRSNLVATMRPLVSRCAEPGSLQRSDDLSNRASPLSAH
jgi:hypothetical protein